MRTKKSKGYLGTKIENKILNQTLSFGMALESLRMRDEISQTMLAKKLKLSRQYICDVEKGRRLVSIEQAVRFAKAFGHPPEVLIELAIQDDIRSAGLKFKVSVAVA